MPRPVPQVVTAMVAYFYNSDQAREFLKTEYKYCGVWYRGRSKLHLFSNLPKESIQKRGYTKTARRPERKVNA